MSPYSLLQGGRRRRRRRGPALAVLALLAIAAGVWAVALRDEDPGPRPARPAGSSAADEELAGGGSVPPGNGTAPIRLAVNLADPQDEVRVRFKHPARAALLFDLDTGDILWRHEPTKVLPIASLTKMMTALVVAEHSRPGQKLRIAPAALRYRGSGVGVLPRNRRVQLESVLNGMLLVSGNDAARALAIGTGGSITRFVGLMNAKARELGLFCTRFSSPDGFRDAGNHSCAADLAALAGEVLKTPRLSRIVRRRQAILPFPIKGGKLYLYNTNPLLRMRYRGTLGVKTGFTDAAGRCLVVAARRGNVRLGVVLLHSPDPGTQARQLLDRGFKWAKARRG
jgi:serine-type D-Ala-D-Ala carboxypeptidase (penicillin-binding protein 5/6)